MSMVVVIQVHNALTQVQGGLVHIQDALIQVHKKFSKNNDNFIIKS
jgi:hypothetical protein